MSFTKCLVVLCTVLLSEVAHAQLPATVPSCDAVKVQANFNTAAYLNRWYEYAYAAGDNEVSGKCYTADYSYGKGGSINVINALTDPTTNTRESVSGSLSLTSTNGDAKFFLVYPESLAGSFYWVLGTDYENYSVVWSCIENISGQNGETQESNANVESQPDVTAWILTRSSEPTPEVIEAAYAVLDANNIPRDFVSVTDQKDCTY